MISNWLPSFSRRSLRSAFVALLPRYGFVSKSSATAESFFTSMDEIVTSIASTRALARRSLRCLWQNFMTEALGV